MYALLVKNNETSWDVIGTLDFSEIPVKASIIDAAIESGNEITGMDTTQYKSSARTNSVWNGSSFTVPDDLGSNPDDSFYDNAKQYSFICDNKIIANVTVNNDSPRSELYAAAFALEVTIVKVPSHQIVYVGETYGWNGTEFVNP
jgi:hypothetical protein